jgi:hypothetical protein
MSAPVVVDRLYGVVAMFTNIPHTGAFFGLGLCDAVCLSYGCVCTLIKILKFYRCIYNSPSRDPFLNILPRSKPYVL